VRLDQIRSVDKRRLLKRLGAVKPTTLTKVDQAIKISLGLVDLA
jgi:mRNA-degrading endonuclease toxin of MazEF toxin-antitoxin module